MSQPELRVELDPAHWTDPEEHAACHAGAEVVGTAIVSAPAPFRCRTLSVSLEWETEGRGDCDGEIAWEQVLHEGELPAGERRFPFRALLPAGPISWKGKHIEIVWTLRVELRLSFWSRDAVVVPLAVRPPVADR